MNRGSALKWVALIGSGTYSFGDHTVLCCYDNDGKLYHSWVGVLEDFVSGFKGKCEVNCCFWNGQGDSISRASLGTLRAVKAKTDLSAVDELYGLSVPEVCSYLTTRYAEL